MNANKHQRLYVTQLVKRDRTGHSGGNVVTKLVRDHIVVHGMWGRSPWKQENYREHHREFTNFADAIHYHDELSLKIALMLGTNQMTTWSHPKCPLPFPLATK